MWRRASWMVCALGLTMAASARAEDNAIPVAVVVRGGASLGSFEAGALHALTEVARTDPTLLDPRVLAGTSAGSINALVSAFTLFGATAPPSTPEQSLYFRTWIPVGTKGMFNAKEVEATGAFTRSGAMAKVIAAVHEAARRGMREGTEVLLAIPVTRMTPRNLDLDDDGALQVQQAGETFVVRLRGRGPGVLPSITNVHDPRGPDRQPSLSTDEQGEVALARLIDVVLASSAIPPAFAPINLTHCVGPKQVRGTVVCRPGDAVTEPFVDGGFVDNLPLKLTTRLTRVARVHERALYLLIDPQEMSYARLAKPQQDSRSFSVMGERLAGGLLDAASGTELRGVLEQDERIAPRLAVLQSELPLASSPLQSFMGFFETEFRLFDFAVGMHEGRRMVREHFRSEALASRTMPELPPIGHESGMQRRSACLAAVLDAEGSDVVCRGAELASFRALLQVSIERLYVQCKRIDAATAARLRPAQRRREAWCLAAYRQAEPPRVPELPDRYADWHETLAERSDVLAYVVRRLAAYRFSWNDLGIGVVSANRARVELALRVGEILRAFAAAQPQDSLLFRSAARTLAQRLEYVPPSHAFHFLSGPSVEVGYSVTHRAAPYRAFRLAGALVFDGLPSLITGDARSYFAVSPELGLELEPPWLTRSMIQTRILLRGGFQLSSGDTLLTRRDSPTPGTPLSRPVIDAAIAVSVLQWMRLQMGLATFPPFQGEPTRFTLRPGLGVQLDLPL